VARPSRSAASWGYALEEHLRTHPATAALEEYYDLLSHLIDEHTHDDPHVRQRLHLAGHLTNTSITDWRPFHALHFSNVYTAQDACVGALSALAVRDLLLATPEHARLYDAVTRPVRAAGLSVHPDDEPVPYALTEATSATTHPYGLQTEHVTALVHALAAATLEQRVTLGDHYRDTSEAWRVAINLAATLPRGSRPGAIRARLAAEHAIGDLAEPAGAYLAAGYIAYALALRDVLRTTPDGTTAYQTLITAALAAGIPTHPDDRLAQG